MGREFTAVEEWLDRRAHRLLDAHGSTRTRRAVIEFGVFVLKQAWACVVGVLLLMLIVAVRLWWPAESGIAKNDVLTIAAVALQIVLVATRLETGRELVVILVFHVVGTAMELFKTDVGSWSYAADGILRIGGVPLFTGFMYGAVGSYMVRVMRIFRLRFERYPRVWATVVVAALIYLNFFTHHWLPDARWLLVAAVVALWWPTWMHFRVYRQTPRVPLLPIFAGVAVFIWVAENIATGVGAWTYPHQEHGWELVSPSKLVSWFLLMIISVVLVTLVCPPRSPDAYAVDMAPRIRAYSAAQVRAAEKPLLEAGVPLMSRAAAALAAELRRRLASREGDGARPARLLLLVGGGDNGGDALYAGAELARGGAEVRLLQTASHRHEAGWAAAIAAGARPVPADAAAAEASHSDAIVDGILGTGTSADPALRGTARTVVAAILPVLAQHPRPLVVAVDLPSGIGPDDGSVPDPTVLPADVTVTFGAIKAGLLLSPAADLAGEVVPVELGLSFEGVEPLIEWEAG